MAVQQGPRAPYASTGSIKTVIEKHRQVGLQTMSLQRLQQIGVTEALAPRTLQALTFLGYYDETGNVTPEFDALRKVSEHDFKPRLAALLREAYAPILQVLDPATATQLDVENAFRGFEPTGQLPRMVQLFIGLMVYAEVMPGEQRRKSPTAGTRTRGARAAGNASARKNDAGADGGASEVGRETPLETPSPPDDGHGAGFTETDGNTFILMMPSGPEMTLTVKMDVMRTSIEDRNFIFKIVDELRGYGTEPAEAPGGKRDTAGKGSEEAEVAS